eukprot:1158450-Pelagomonas_calceolata.AAC.2
MPALMHQPASVDSNMGRLSAMSMCTYDFFHRPPQAESAATAAIAQEVEKAKQPTPPAAGGWDLAFLQKAQQSYAARIHAHLLDMDRGMCKASFHLAAEGDTE